MDFCNLAALFAEFFSEPPRVDLGLVEGVVSVKRSKLRQVVGVRTGIGFGCRWMRKRGVPDFV
jgi:hypothetical protein